MSSRNRFLLLAFAAGILFVGAIQRGDIAGYDDALFSTEAKNIVHSGDWLNPSIRGSTALEHPPLFVWTQAALFSLGGVSDMLAKLPAALGALGTVMLVFWLARRLLRDTLAASIAMFVMLATPYFIKYASHAMTDIPTTFLFICAMCAWSMRDRDWRWCLAAGAFAALSLLTRGFIGIALLMIFAIDLLLDARLGAAKEPGEEAAKPAPRHPLGVYAATVAIALVPLAAWYAYSLWQHPDFVSTHQGWLEREVYGGLNPPWRRYTGAPEYAFMLLKSYWPWLPAMVAGILLVIRERRRELYPLLAWAGVVFLLCAVTRSRVLRYMLPAYPAFSILSAFAITRFAPRRILESAMNWIPPAALAAALGIVLLWRPDWHAAEIQPIARAANAPGQLVAFYDEGQPRWDEANQLEWYGNCVPRLLLTSAELDQALRTRLAATLIIDKGTYTNLSRTTPNHLIAESGHLVYIRLE